VIVISCRQIWRYSFLNINWVSLNRLFLHFFFNLLVYILYILQWFSVQSTFLGSFNYLFNWTYWYYNLFDNIIYWLPGTLRSHTAILPFNLNLWATLPSQCFESTYHSLAMPLITSTSTLCSFYDFETFRFLQGMYCYCPEWYL
jgi:hypothetical protein